MRRRRTAGGAVGARLCAAAMLLLVAYAARGQVVGWRGDGSGIAADATPPGQWTEKENIAWSVQVGRSWSTPVVAGDRVFVSAEPDELICVDRAAGKILWRKSHGADELPADLREKFELHQTSCGYATPTPVCDGKRVFVAFGTGVVAAYDLSGQRLWITLIAQDPVTPYGRSASPLLVGQVLVVPMSHYVALDAETGKVIWEQPDADAGYGSPVLMDTGQWRAVITPTGFALRVEDGAILTDQLPTLNYASAVVLGDVGYFMDTSAEAVRLKRTEEGKLTVESLWDQLLEGEFFASPVVHDGLVYACNSLAGYSVFDAKTGDRMVHKTLELPPAGRAEGNGPFVYPSLVLAGGRLYVSNTSGDTFVLSPGQEHQELARLRIGDDLQTAPVFAGKQAFFRAGETLVCVGE